MRLRVVVARFLLAGVVLLLPALLPAKTVTLAAVDRDTAICLVEGDTLIVTLDSPMYEDYRWQQERGRSSPLSAVRDDYTPPSGPKGEGLQTFRFNAASAGSATLTLLFQRQKPGAGLATTQSFSVKANVAPGQPEGLVPLGRYRGTTLCADCTGIDTELRLYAKGQNDFTDTIFVSTRTYRGGRNGDQSFTERGEWSVMKGDATDPNATVYALSPGRAEQAEYLLVQPGGAMLTQLDQQLRPVDAPPQYLNVLKRVN